MNDTTAEMFSSVLTAEANVPVAGVSATAVELRQLQRGLLSAVSTSSDDASLLTAVGSVVAEALSPLAMRYFKRRDQRELAPSWQLRGRRGAQDQAIMKSLSSLAAKACQKGFLQVDQNPARSDFVAVAVPVFLLGRPPEALALALPSATQLLERAIVLMQLAATHVTLWHLLQDSQRTEADAQSSAALLEIIAKVETCASLTQASYTLATEMQQYVSCQRVAIGLRQKGTEKCRLRALSEHVQFDRNSSLVRGIESALEESVLRGTLAAWPHEADLPRHATRALQTVCNQHGFHAAFSSPLEDESGEIIGAWLFAGDDELAKKSESTHLVRAAALPCGSCLQLLLRAEQGTLARLSSTINEHRKSARGRWLLVTAVVLGMILCWPMHYHVKCDCQVESLTRRYVAAPFDGRLEKALVGPGDIVRQGDPLAELDGQDIRWELAGAEANREQAAKRRDAALASHDLVTAQLARLEVQRLDLTTKILQQRAANLIVKSPLDGVVVSGDQEHAEGAPLSVGQALFEVAPLDNMVVELAIPEDEITHINQGRHVSFQLEAFPGRTFDGTVANVQPRSEVKEDRNVFVAELHFANVDGSLRPGMSGQARVRTDRHTLAWNLFHKPWHFLRAKLGL